MKILNNLVFGLMAFGSIGFGGNEGPHGGDPYLRIFASAGEYLVWRTEKEPSLLTQEQRDALIQGVESAQLAIVSEKPASGIFETDGTEIRIYDEAWLQMIKERNELAPLDLLAEIAHEYLQVGGMDYDKEVSNRLRAIPWEDFLDWYRGRSFLDKSEHQSYFDLMKQRFTEASTPTEEDLRGWKGYQVGRCWQSETSRKNHPLPAAFLLSEIKNSNELGPMFEQNLFKFIQTEIYSDTSLVADAFDNITPPEIEDLYSNNFIKNTNIERLTEGYVTLKGILENPGIVAPATVQETFGEPAYVSEYVNKIKYKQGIFSYTGKYRARIEVKRYGPYMLTYLPKHIDSSNLFCYFFKSIGNGEPEKGALFELFNPTRASNTENHVIVVPQGTYKIVSHHLDPQNRQAYYIIRVPNVGDVSVYASRGRVKRK